MVTLTGEQIMKLVKLRATIKAMQKEEQTLTNNLKDRMVEKEVDEFAPRSSPYKLVKLEYDKTAVDWKDVAVNAFKKLWGTRWKEKLAQEKADYGKEYIISLIVEPNERFNQNAA